MKGSDFEKLCLDQMKWEERRGTATANRYGVQGTRIDGVWQPIHSLPDFEGVLSDGWQFMFDSKVCQQSSFSLSKFRPGTKEAKARQLTHMLNRADFNVGCFFLIYWPKRILKTRIDPEQTWAFPIHREHPFWIEFLNDETSSISRDDCEQYGVPVQWEIKPRCRTSRPDILPAIIELRARDQTPTEETTKSNWPPTPLSSLG